MLNFMPFTFKRLSIPDVILVEPNSFSDDRGFFFESYKESDFLSNGIDKKFVQDNFSHSVYSVIRGLHFQKTPKAQAKLVTVLKGKIFDVAVDIRKNSPTYGKWVSEILSDNIHNLLYIPEGFAHGYLVTSSESIVIYKCTDIYDPNDQYGIIWNDETIGVDWMYDSPILSEKDLMLPALNDQQFLPEY